jgi:hypothetical protein
MKRWIWRATAAGVFVMGLMAAGARAEDNDGCSDATLNGDYAFTISGTIWMPDSTGAVQVIQRDGIAMTHFNGTGGLTQVDFVLSSPNAKKPAVPPPTDPVTGFHTEETGTYKVYSDCTGTFTINSAGPVITVKFVLSDHGWSIHTIVTSLILPGHTEPVPALIHSEGNKVGRIREESH